MSILYNAIQRHNPNDANAPKKWYLILKRLKLRRTLDVAKAISDETTLNPKEAEMALYQLHKVLLRYLMDGNTVELGDLGTFQLSVNSSGVSQEEDVTPNLVKKINLHFIPSTEVREAINKATFIPAKSLLHK